MAAGIFHQAPGVEGFDQIMATPGQRQGPGKGCERLQAQIAGFGIDALEPALTVGRQSQAQAGGLRDGGARGLEAQLVDQDGLGRGPPDPTHPTRQGFEPQVRQIRADAQGHIAQSGIPGQADETAVGQVQPEAHIAFTLLDRFLGPGHPMAPGFEPGLGHPGEELAGPGTGILHGAALESAP